MVVSMSWNRAFYRCEFYLHSAFGYHDVALIKADEDFPADTVALSYFTSCFLYSVSQTFR